jgi:hypothetical protein
MNLNEKIEKLEKELAELKQEVSRNNQQATINSVEDAFNLFKPRWWICDRGNIQESTYSIQFNINQCNMTSEKRAKQIKALIQLHLIAEAMNLGFKEENDYYAISSKLFVASIFKNLSYSILFPTFHTRELAEEALEKFKDLFKDLYMLND